MLTLKIEDKKFEEIFVEKFHSDMHYFVEYIKATIAPKSEREDDLPNLEEKIKQAEKSGLSSKSHEEIWNELFQKYNVT